MHHKDLIEIFSEPANPDILMRYVARYDPATNAHPVICTNLCMFINKFLRGEQKAENLATFCRSYLENKKIDENGLRLCLLATKEYLQSRDFYFPGKYSKRVLFWGVSLSQESKVLMSLYHSIDNFSFELYASVNQKESVQTDYDWSSFYHAIYNLIQSGCNYILNHPYQVLFMCALVQARLAAASSDNKYVSSEVSQTSSSLLDQCPVPNNVENHFMQPTCYYLEPTQDNWPINHIASEELPYEFNKPSEPSFFSKNGKSAPKFQKRNNLSVEVKKPGSSRSKLEKIAKEIGISQYYSKQGELIDEPVSSLQKRRIQKALVAVSNKAVLLKLVSNRVRIDIVSEEVMYELVGIENFSSAFVAAPYNNILLNQHIFSNWNSGNEEQLITCLANEISHAVTHNERPEELKINETNPYDGLVPWRNEQQKQQYLQAYKVFEENISEYKQLIAKSRSKYVTMNSDELKKLHAYDAAMKTYIPPRFGKESLNAMQVSFHEAGAGHIIVDKDFENKLPPLSEPKARLQYLRENFFQQIENKRIQDNIMRERGRSIYTESVSQITADALSDFETLPPQVRLTFGEDLCNYLDGFLDVINHCHRPFWPRPA